MQNQPLCHESNGCCTFWQGLRTKVASTEFPCSNLPAVTLSWPQSPNPSKFLCNIANKLMTCFSGCSWYNLENRRKQSQFQFWPFSAVLRGEVRKHRYLCGWALGGIWHICWAVSKAGPSLFPAPVRASLLSVCPHLPLSHGHPALAAGWVSRSLGGQRCRVCQAMIPWQPPGSAFACSTLTCQTKADLNFKRAQCQPGDGSSPGVTFM